MFRAIVEATCFGAKAIVDRFVEQGIPVKGLIGLGGVAKKSPFIMQMMANVMNMPIRIHQSEQTCAIGAAMFAATAAGLYDRVEDAMKAMGQGFERTYMPDEKLVSFGILSGNTTLSGRTESSQFSLDSVEARRNLPFKNNLSV